MPDAKWSITAAGRGMHVGQSRAMWRMIRNPSDICLSVVTPYCYVNLVLLWFLAVVQHLLLVLYPDVCKLISG